MTSLTRQVVAVFGPTAAGKTAVSEILAGALGTEVVSADALQVYRGLPILTNQPESPTRLVAIRDLSHEFSVGEYAQLAHEAIDELARENGVAVVSGAAVGANVGVVASAGTVVGASEGAALGVGFAAPCGSTFTTTAAGLPA